MASPDVELYTERQRSNAMIKKALFATFALAVLGGSAAAAEYYVMQDRDTKKCKVVETRPTETTWIQVGPLAFKTQDEADRQLKVICKETR
jgi:hypothetical protein